jgi:3-deoxy-D-manno-octulosonate 8-phosphate phosphatase (KDO 8-P phosphatase)
MKYTDIKLVVVDVDGTLTNGVYTVSSNGVTSKSFFTRDFYALEALMDNEISVLILTNSGDDCISHRINEIISNSNKWKKFEEKRFLCVAKNVPDKKKYIETMCNINMEEQVAYIGDAQNDIEAMKKCLHTGCPFDAIEEVKEESGYISDYIGGSGAVYDFVMHILEKRKKEIIHENLRTK